MRTKLIFILTISVLIFVACSKSSDDVQEKGKYDEQPVYSEYFKENLTNYVNDRYSGEVEKVYADSINGYVILRDQALPNSEIHGRAKEFTIKAPLEFFLLVNGLYKLKLEVYSEGQKYTLELNRNQFANFYKVKLSDLNNPDQLSNFEKANYTKDKNDKFFDQFIKVQPAA